MTPSRVQKQRHSRIDSFLFCGIFSSFLTLCFSSCDKDPTPNRLSDSTPKTAEQIWTEISPSLIYVAAAGIDGTKAQGSGFIVELDGKRLVLTNRHVVKGAEKVMVGTDAETLLPSVSYKIASDLDLAVVECPESLKAPPLRLATRPLNPGAEVIALGFPLGLSKVITRGVVSAVEDQYVLFDAPISSGNSGGPVVNQFGEVIGVATMGSQSRGAAVVQNLNVGIRVGAIPKLPVFQDPVLRLSAISDRVREVEAFIERGYQEGDYFALYKVIAFNWLTANESAKDLQAKAANPEKARESAGQIAVARKKLESQPGGVRAAVEKYVAFLKECEARIDRLPAAFAGLGNDVVLRDFLQDDRRGGWARVNATPELLPELARISADHWLATIEDHRFRLEWALRYSSGIPQGPSFAVMDAKDSIKRSNIRLRHELTNHRETDLTAYIETMIPWRHSAEVTEDSYKQFQKNGSAEKNPIKAQKLHGDLLSLVSKFRQYLAIEAAEKGNFDSAIKSLRADIGNLSPSCWSGALLAQQLVFAGRFDEAWLAYENHFAGPPPFNAFDLKRGRGLGSHAFTLLHVCEGMNIDGADFRKQFGKYPNVETNVRRWNELVKAVEGQRLTSLKSLRDVLSSEWFQKLSRFSRIRVLSYFRYVRPDEEWAAYFSEHGHPPKIDSYKELKDFESNLTTSPADEKLWAELSVEEGIFELF